MCETRMKLTKVRNLTWVSAAFHRYRRHQNEFVKSLTQNLKNLRKIDQLARKSLYGLDVPDMDYSEGEDDEYVFRVSKRRKVIES